MLCVKIVWNWPSGSGEDVKNMQSLRTDRQTDKMRSEKLTLAFSLGELKMDCVFTKQRIVISLRTQKMSVDYL